MRGGCDVTPRMPICLYGEQRHAIYTNLSWDERFDFPECRVIAYVDRPITGIGNVLISMQAHENLRKGRCRSK
jgi:hypothetical protein